MTVGEMLERISSKELTEWMIYFNYFPFGEVRQDIQSALVSCTMANSFSTKKHKLNDFMLKFKAPKTKKKQSLDDMKNILKAYTDMYNNNYDRIK